MYFIIQSQDTYVLQQIILVKDYRLVPYAMIYLTVLQSDLNRVGSEK